MNMSDVTKKIDLQGSSRPFIKWWRREQDFIDFDLVDRFKRNAGSGGEIEGFELIGMDEMWHELKRLCGERIDRDLASSTVIWEREGKGRKVCTYSPESLMDILDVETRGNYVD